MSHHPSGSGVRRSHLFLLLLCAAALAPRPATAFEILTRDKDARFAHDASGGGWAHVRIGADRALQDLNDPRCPAVSKIRVSSYKDNRVVGEPLAELPCSAWRKIPGGFLYSDPSGSVAGIEKVRYTTRGLEVYASAPGHTPVVGPIGFAQLNFEIDGRRFIARFHNFLRNDGIAVVAKRPSRAAADGEAAFWDTLGGRNRDLEALDLLNRATQQDPRDGRSHFLTGMMHLQRFERIDADPRHASDAGRLELIQGLQAFDRASPLLWDGVRGDSRAPGFASAALYKKGVAFDEPDVEARGFAAMAGAADINPLFNGFIPFGAGPIASPDSPEYALILHLLDDVFPTLFPECGGQDEICFNGGLAPHNLEGTFLLFGDLYTKAGRIADAQKAYETAAKTGESGGWSPAFVAHARELAAAVPERAALYGNADPDDDPPFTDLGGAGNCAYCHNQ
ncbi:MAG: hypothetical protein U0842_03990 [Candidatus Binatia bacterium]